MSEESGGASAVAGDRAGAGAGQLERVGKGGGTIVVSMAAG